MKLIIVRHGETEENRAGIIQGHLPGKLTRKGIAQAKLLAKRLANERITRIYTSDLARAKDTTEHIKAYHPKTPIEVTPLLREFSFGKTQGKRRVDVDPALRAKHREPHASVAKRARAIFRQAYRKNPHGTILFVTHGGFIVMILRFLLKQAGKTVEPDYTLNPNTGVTVLHIRKDKRHRLVLYNDDRHLQ